MHLIIKGDCVLSTRSVWVGHSRQLVFNHIFTITLDSYSLVWKGLFKEGVLCNICIMVWDQPLIHILQFATAVDRMISMQGLDSIYIINVSLCVSIYVSLYLSLYLSLSLFIYLYIYLSVYISVCLSVCPAVRLVIYLFIWIHITCIIPFCFKSFHTASIILIFDHCLCLINIETAPPFKCVVW